MSLQASKFSKTAFELYETLTLSAAPVSTIKFYDRKATDIPIIEQIHNPNENFYLHKTLKYG